MAKPAHAAGELLPVRAFAQLAGVSERTVWYDIKARRLKRAPGLPTRVPRSALATYRAGVPFTREQQPVLRPSPNEENEPDSDGSDQGRIRIQFAVIDHIRPVSRVAPTGLVPEHHQRCLQPDWKQHRHNGVEGIGALFRAHTSLEEICRSGWSDASDLPLKQFIKSHRQVIEVSRFVPQLRVMRFDLRDDVMIEGEPRQDDDGEMPQLGVLSDEPQNIEPRPAAAVHEEHIDDRGGDSRAP